MASKELAQEVDTVSLEKQEAQSPTCVQKYMSKGLTYDDAVFLDGLSPQQEAKTFHKVDWRLVPMLGRQRLSIQKRQD